jgi:hypothetical protein
MASNGIINRLRKIFGISDVKTNDVANQKKVHPGVRDSKTGKLKPVEFPDEIQKLYDYWLKDTFETASSLKNRLDRYAALSYAYYNNTIFSKAVNLYADETVQSDVNDEILNVEADKKVKNYIYDFLDTLGIRDGQKLHNVAHNLVLYGDSFWINSADLKRGEGFTDSTPINVEDIADRIEFNASNVAKDQRKNNKFITHIQKSDRLSVIYKMLKDTKENQDYSQFFKSYLFGYWLADKIYLPPWNVSHFRIFTTINEFAPFGRPIMINCLAPFRQLQAGKNLMALARANNFPIKKFEVTVDENMDQGDIWEVIDEARSEYHNLGYSETDKEQFAMGGEVWLPRDLINMDNVESRMDLDAIADIEMLRDDLIMGTDIPKGYLIVDRASFGTSGQALLRQHKPFARAVYKIQTAILEQITQMIRLQFAISGDFDYDTPFELSMPFPEVEESSDRIRIKNDTLRLAKDVLDNLGDAIGLDRGEALPPDVVKAVFSQISFLDDDDVMKWVDDTVEAQQQEPEEPEGGGGMFGNKKFVNKNKIRERLTPQVVKECWNKARKNTKIYENISNDRHHYSSYNISPDNRLQLELVSTEPKKLREKYNVFEE